MGPADLLEYDRTRLRAVVLEEGGATAHVAIVARSLGLVAVGQAENIVSLSRGRRRHHRRWPGRHRPSAAHRRRRGRPMSTRSGSPPSGGRTIRELRDKPSVTRDGVAITLLHNSGLVADLPMLDDTGAAGVGLFRTELQFMIASQAAAAQRAGRALSRGDPAHRRASPIVFRLLDIGGDKVIPYLRSDGRRKPGHGLPLAAAGARPARPAAHPDPGAAAGGRGRAAEDSRADGHRDLRVPRRHGWSSARKSNGWSARANRCPPSSNSGR